MDDKYKNKKKTWLIVTLLIILVGIVVGGYMYYKKMTTFSAPTKETVKIEELKVEDDYLINFLILGDDNDEERASETDLAGNRSDSMMLVSMNTKTSKVLMYNIPRDTITTMYSDNDTPTVYLGKNATKINSAYDLGGVNSSRDTIEELLPGIDINYYWTFNFLSFKDIVDSIGGIEMDVPVDIYNYHMTEVLVPAGEQHLNGEQALDVVRARAQDDDIQRGYRQQMVLEAIAKKMQDDVTLPQMLKLLEAINKNIETDMRINDIKSLFTVAIDKDWEFERVEAHWFPFMANEESMVMLPTKSRELIVSKFRDNLGKEEEVFPIDNTLQTQLNVLQLDLTEKLNVDPYNQPIVSYETINEIFAPVFSN